MRKPTWLKMLALALVLVFICAPLSGCTPESSTPDTTTTDPVSGDADVGGDDEGGESTTPSRAGESLTIGISTNALANIHNRHMFESVTEAVEAAGHRAITVNANGAAAQQSVDIENLVQAGCDVIIIQNGDAFSLKNAVQEASSQGVYVISQDSGWIDGCSAMFTLNSFSVGAEIYMMLAAETDFNGKIITTGHQDNFALRSIGQMQQAFVNEYTDFEIVAHVQTTFPGTTEVTYNGLESALLANPDVGAIWTSQDLEAMGAIQALKEAGLYPQVKCVGVDGELDVLKDIQAGGSVICTAISDLDGCAIEIVDYAERLVAGETLPKAVSIPFTVVTAANVDEFIAKAEAEQEMYAD